MNKLKSKVVKNLSLISLFVIVSLRSEFRTYRYLQSGEIPVTVIFSLLQISGFFLQGITFASFLIDSDKSLS